MLKWTVSTLKALIFTREPFLFFKRLLFSDLPFGLFDHRANVLGTALRSRAIGFAGIALGGACVSAIRVEIPQWIAEALVIRGSSDFTDLDAYRTFVRETIARHNRQIDARLAEERPHLKPLPSSAVPSYTTFHVRVRKWSTIRVGRQTYSVPSRLRDHWVEVHRHPDVIEVRYRGKHVETMPRLRGDGAARIDYRHVIWSLVTKPGAFARYRYREELFPTLVFRRAYDALKSRTERSDVEYLRILHLAASTMEKPVEDALAAMLDAGEPVSFDAVRERVAPTKPSVPQIAIPAPDLTSYDRLLTAGGAA